MLSFAARYGTQRRKLHRHGRTSSHFPASGSPCASRRAARSWRRGPGGRTRTVADAGGGRRRGGAPACRPGGWPRPVAPRAARSLRPRPLPVARQRAGGGGTAPRPHADRHVRRRGRSARPPRPVRTAKTAASARRPTKCCARSAARPSPRCSCPDGRSRWRPTSPLRNWPICGMPCTVCPSRRRTPRRSATLPSCGKIVLMRRAIGARQSAAAAPPRWFPDSPTSAGRHRRCGNGRCRRCRSPIP